MQTLIEPRALRQVLSTFVTGVTVVTTVDAQGQPHGLTANSFSSVSLDPPLVLWSQALAAYSHPLFRDAQRFSINILADDQIDVSNRFAKAGEDKFGQTRVRAGLGGIPLIEGCAAYLECRRVASHLAGDHMIFIGEVERIERCARQPLAFGGGRYMIPHAHDFGRLGANQAAANRTRMQAARLATHAAVELSARLDETVGVGVWGNHGPTIIHWEPSAQPVSLNLRLGAVLPVLASATGQVFAAWLPAEATAPFIEAELAAGAGAEILCDGRGQDRAWADRMDGIRRTGLASMHSVSRFLDRDAVSVASVSVPVFDASGAILLTLTALAESERLDVRAQAAVPSALRACAQDLTRRIGGA